MLTVRSICLDCRSMGEGDAKECSVCKGRRLDIIDPIKGITLHEYKHDTPRR